ncbi:MAG: microviridin/marinostatin family tricyclic proteinase inhibitor [Planctomycetota bacterium]
MSQQQTNVPFFVRFLETQEALVVESDVKAGKPNHTLKYPSDGDEV